MDFSILERRIKDSFFHESGPGDLPFNIRNSNVEGVIVPEENLPVMAWGYKELAESTFPKTYVVFKSGQNNCILVNDINSSFGIVQTDLEMVNSIQSKFSFEDVVSCNVDLSFLQFVSKQYLKSLKVVVLFLKDFSPELVEFFSELKDVVFLGLSLLSSSSDGVYSGLDLVKTRDDFLIKCILNLDENKLIDFCENKKIDGVILITMVALMKLRFAKPHMLYHETVQGLVSKGYAGFVFKR